MKFIRETEQARDVIGMFMRDQDGGEFFRRLADAGEAFADLQRRKTRIHENAGFVGFQISTITVGTAAENGELNGHTKTLTVQWNAGKYFWRFQTFGRSFLSGKLRFNPIFIFRSLT